MCAVVHGHTDIIIRLIFLFSEICIVNLEYVNLALEHYAI